MHGHIAIADAVNWDCSLTRGLVSWWACLPDQQRGLYWRDLCGRSVGTLTNMDPATDWLGPQGRPGGFGRLNFDGSDDYVNIAAGGGLAALGDVMTMATWFRTTSAARQTVIGREEAGGAAQFEINTLGAQGELRIIISGVSIAWTATGHFSANQWVNGVYTRNGAGSTHALYVDGVSSLSGSNTNSFSDSTSWMLGRRTSALQKFSGDLAEVAVWNRALSASEVALLYQDSLLGHPRMLNWIEPRYYVSAAAAPAGGIYKFPARMTGGMMEYTAGMRA